MLEYPPGHVGGICLTLEFVPPALMRQAEQNEVITIPHDLAGIPDYDQGMPLQVLDLLCVKCRRPWAEIQWDDHCEADDKPPHLRGGQRERAPRQKAKPGTTAVEVVARQKQKREMAAYMQRSRINAGGLFS